MADFTNKVQVVFKGGGEDQPGRPPSKHCEYGIWKIQAVQYGENGKEKIYGMEMQRKHHAEVSNGCFVSSCGGVPDAFLVTDIKLESQTTQANLYFQYYENWTGMYTTKAMLIYKMYQKYN